MDREREMYRLHTEEGWTLVEIARRYHVSRERVRQLLREYVHASTGEWPSSRVLSRTAAQARQSRKLALAQAHARHIMAAWRAGEEPKEIAATLGLGRRRVEQVIREEATSDDRASRVRAQRLVTAGLGRKPSSEQRVLHAVSSNPGATASELATATGLAYGTTTVALRKLERSGEATRAKGEHKAGVRLPDRWTAVRLSNGYATSSPRASCSNCSSKPSKPPPTHRPINRRQGVAS